MQGLNFESKMGRLAREIETASFQGQEVDIGFLQDRLGPEFSRKQISDWAAKLVKRGYLEKLGPGKFKAKPKLHQFAGRKSAQDEERPEESPAVIVRKKARAKRAEAGQAGHEAELTRLESLVQSLEACLTRLESITDKFQDRAELQELMDVLDKILAKRKKMSK